MSTLDFLRDLVRIDSTPGKEEAAIRLAAERMTRLGFDEVTVDSHGNLLGEIGPLQGPTLVLDGHIDTIPLHSAKAWTHSPYQAEIADGRLYGLGAVDMKAGVAALIDGAASVDRSRLHGTALVSISIAEEMLEGATLQRTFENRAVSWCVIAEPTDLQIATAQRGRARVQVEIFGRSVHAASSRLGVNAAARMATFTETVTAMPPQVHPLLGARDINLIDIHSEPYPSISTIPAYCVARYDVRFLPGETRESLLGIFHSSLPTGLDGHIDVMPTSFTTYVGDEYNLDDMAVPWETPRDHKLVRCARQATSANQGVFTFCTNGSYFAGERGIPTIGYGPGSSALAHAPDEYVPIAHIEQAREGYRRIIEELLT
jgi:putative selenium metabolism hydrolase